MEMSPAPFQGVLPTIPVPVSQGLASPPRTAGHRAGSGADWAWQAGSGLRQMAAGGRHHCCPDFFSFWKLKLVRLFSFLCF